MRLILSIIFFLVFSNWSKSNSELKFYHIWHEQGFYQSNINDITQDFQGYFWFCTSEGLSKWDGYNFTNYRHNSKDTNSIALGKANVVLEDKNNNLWIGTRQGNISKYIREYDYFENYPIKEDNKNHIGNIDITDILPFNNNLIISTSGKGIYYFDINKKTYTPIQLSSILKPDLKKLIVNKLYIDKDSNLWVGHIMGALKVSLNQLQENIFSLTGKEFFINKNIQDIYQDKQGDIWFGSNASGIFILSNSNNTTKQLKAGKSDSKHLNHNSINKFIEDRQGNMWIGTEGGGINIYNFANHKITYHIPKLGDKYSISSNIINSFYSDKNQNIWISTFNGGVSYTNHYKQSFNHTCSFGLPNELNNNAILSFCETPDGKIWIGTDGGGINVYNPETNIHSEIKLPLIKNVKVITALKTDNKGNVYIGTYRDGLFIYNFITGKTKHFQTNNSTNSVNCNNIWDIAFSNDKKTVWIATLGGGLNKYIPSKESFSYFTYSDDSINSIPENYLNCLCVDSQDNLWVGTHHKGLCVLPKGSNNYFTLYKQNDRLGLSSNEIRVILKDSKQRILVGTQYGGLNIFNPSTKQFTAFKSSEGLPGNSVSGIIEDETGFLWLSTNKGLSRVDISDSNTITTRNFGTSNGLQSNEYNLHSTLKTKDNTLYFGGINGYNYFKASDIISNSYTGNIVIVGMKIFDKDIALEREKPIITKSLQYDNTINLKHWQSTFTFEFAMLDFTVPEINTYEFRLKEFENNWVQSGTRRYATYTNINPGRYTFEVRGINSLGIRSKQTATIQVFIKPPFYQTTLFRILFALLLITGLFLSYRIRVKTLRIRGNKLKAMVTDRTKELQSANILLESKTLKIRAQRDALQNHKQTLINTNVKLEKSYKRIEQQKIELEEHRYNLEETVKNRTIALEKAKEKAEESEKLKMAFLSNMSHEIRTPMNAIVGFASLLADDDINSNERKEYIEQVNNNSESLLILIDDILDLSKIEANQLQVNKSIFEVNAFVYEIFNNWRILKQKNNNSNIDLLLSNNLIHKTVFVNSDALRLGQVLNNLLDNAFKFTNKGEIEIGVDMNLQQLVFTVRDSGIGIQETDLNQIFNRFRKADETGKKLYRGVGLGLTISNKLAGLLNGKLSLTSNYGSGSTFSLSIPIGETSDMKNIYKEKNTPNNKDFNVSQLKVLIAEDEETNFSYLNKILTKNGITVERAMNGREAVDMALTQKYKLVLMDIKMPVMDGLEATRAIKSIFPKQVIIAQTAFARLEEEVEFMKAGFDAYISKPINIKNLMQLIVKHVS